MPAGSGGTAKEPVVVLQKVNWPRRTLLPLMASMGRHTMTWAGCLPTECSCRDIRGGCNCLSFPALQNLVRTAHVSKSVLLLAEQRRQSRKQLFSHSVKSELR